MTKQMLHPMSVVTRRTGLSADLIRAWERRYGAVQPERTGANRRLYSEAEITRLMLLRDALRKGWQIGQIAKLDEEDLRALASEPAATEPGNGQAEKDFGRLEARIDACMRAVSDLDGTRLSNELDAAAVALSRIDLLDNLLVPLMHRIGESCGTGALRTANEHLASVVVRSFVDRMQNAYPVDETSPAILVTTPVYQHHELGALLVAATSRILGWRTTYLGPNLPAEEIAAAARLRSASVVALSVTFPPDDPNIHDELRRLVRLLPRGVSLIVGGSSAAAYQAVIDDIGAERIDSLASLRARLDSLRNAALSSGPRVETIPQDPAEGSPAARRDSQDLDDRAP